MILSHSVVRRAARVALSLCILALVPSCGVGGILAGSAGGGGGGGGDTRPPRPPRVTLVQPTTDPASNAISLSYDLNDPQEKDAGRRARRTRACGSSPSGALPAARSGAT